jgi:hypothetical protein
MWFWLMLIFLVIGSIAWIVSYKFSNYDTKDDSAFHKFVYRYEDAIKISGGTITIISIVIVLCMVIGICINHNEEIMLVDTYRQQYQALVYKLETDTCRDELGLLSKTVIDEIQNWNTDLAYKKNVQDNFWVGIFYPNIYDEFEFIDYNNYNKQLNDKDIGD